MRRIALSKYEKAKYSAQINCGWSHDLTMPLQSNWPYKDQCAVARKNLEDLWYVDDYYPPHKTFGIFDTEKAAKEFGRFCKDKVRIRHYNPTDEDRDEELREQRHIKRLTR